MNRRLPLRPLLALLCGGLLSPAAWSALSCAMTAVPGTLTGAYASASDLNLQGALNLNCTRLATDSATHTLYIGFNQTAGATLSKLAPYADTLNYGVYRSAGGVDLWTDTVGAAPGGGSGGMPVSLNFGGGGALAASLSIPVYMRVPLGQTLKSAGTYSQSLTATLRPTDWVGTPVLATTPMTFEATIANNCAFDVAPISYTVSYQAFRATDLVDTSQGVNVTCTRGTTYSLALDAAVGVIPTVELTYGLTFTSTGGINVSGTATTQASPTNWGLTLRLPAGQAGACTGTCSGSSVRTLTVTY